MLALSSKSLRKTYRTTFLLHSFYVCRNNARLLLHPHQLRMPRKNKNNAKHPRYVKPDYHSQNKNEDIDIGGKAQRKKNKLRTSLDIYKRLLHDRQLRLDLNYIAIGYEDTEQVQEMPFFHWKMVEDGGDVPMHRIHYFVLYLIDGERILLWEKQSKLDRLFCSGNANKSHYIKKLLSQRNPNNVPYIPSQHAMEPDSDDEGKDDDEKQEQHHNVNSSIRMLDDLISTFSMDMSVSAQKRYEIILTFRKERVIQEPVIETRLQRNDYKLIANKTKQILENGRFMHPISNRNINIADDIKYSVEHAELYSEQHAFPYMDIDKHGLRKYQSMHIDITHETTLDCAYRLVQEHGTECCDCMVMLNFSSARNAGGGWDTGSVAQEESIARSSTLIASLTQFQSEFYDYHREKKTMLYSHALIYTPQVVVMKHGNGVHLPDDEEVRALYKCNVITSPAVNAGNYVKRAKVNEYLMKKVGGLKAAGKVDEKERQNAAWRVVDAVMMERCKRVLELAMKHNNRYLILGAWGCGVFGNEPNMIARIFAELLRDRYYNVFERVVFAILDHPKKRTMDKFIGQFDRVWNDVSRQKNEYEIRMRWDHRKSGGSVRGGDNDEDI